MILTFGPIPGPEGPAPPPPLSPEPTPVLESPAGPFPPAPPPSGSPPGTPPGEPGLPPCGEMENAPWRLPGGRVTESVAGAGSTLRLSSPAFAAEVFRVSSSARLLASAFSVAWVAGAGCGVGWGAGSGGAGAAGAAGRGTGSEGFGKGLRGGTRASRGAEGGATVERGGTTTCVSIGLGGGERDGVEAEASCRSRCWAGESLSEFSVEVAKKPE